MLLDIDDLDFSGTTTHYVVLANDGWDVYGAYDNYHEALSACCEAKKELEDDTCRVYSFSIIANEVEE